MTLESLRAITFLAIVEEGANLRILLPYFRDIIMFKLGLTVDSQRRYKSFIKDLSKDKSVLFYIKKEDQAFVLTESNDFLNTNDEPLPVLPVWSETYAAYAKTYIDEGHLDFVELVDFSGLQFLELIKEQLQGKDLILGFNWDQNLVGSEYTIDQFLKHVEIFETTANLTDKDLARPLN